MLENSRVQTALVTGCGRADGMGVAIARRLAANGYQVALLDRFSEGVLNEGEAASAENRGVESHAREIAEATGVRTLAVIGDIADPSDVERVYSQVEQELGPVSILVNNAAAPQGRDRVDIADVPLEAWHEQLRVNLTGTFLMIQRAVPGMREHRYGRIVNISSMAAKSAAGQAAAYSASKAGVLGLTRSVAMDLAPWGVTVNAICPGLVMTSRAKLGERQGRKPSGGDMGSRIAVGRGGQPADIAAAVDYLTHPDNGYITAQTLVLDGGGISPFPVKRPDPQD
ncbi:SDR family NAD(P)-dependent oxidoreductase [Nesterenkonia flava]|uniref:SDR family oxidoreductase n=1 Tax=Nesterenkonia flava TaxID=469799 RepID=A0ABU1FVB0_9MICC|nr:SDR family oxidoreductase [Nesterenkonia flava]MDR5712603.1 SDR family oxidoreductase [Nesterenkonia flava]